MKKRFFSFAVAAALVLGLAGCGGVLVDYETPKSEELSTQYDFYSDSQRELSSGMAITPEQADEVFLVLVSCGMDGKVSSVTRKAGDEGHCTVSALGSLGAFDVYYMDGVVDRVEKGGKELYPNPEPEQTDELNTEEPVEPTTPETLEEIIDAAIESAHAEKEEVKLFDTYSEENPDERRVAIYLAGSDNLTTNMIRKGMWMEGTDILKALQSCENISEVVLYWSFPMVDAYGKSITDTVMKIDVSKETLDNINFEQFLFENLPEIADEYFEHAALAE